MEYVIYTLCILLFLMSLGGLVNLFSRLFREKRELLGDVQELRRRLNVYEGHDFQRGDKVRKCKGRYKWDGRLLGAFLTSDVQVSYVVEHPVDEGYVLHIYTGEQLERIP